MDKIKQADNSKTFIGTVVSTKMAKTAVVVVNREILDKTYHKQYQTSKKFKVHDEKNSLKVGDQIVFQGCRPLSKEKKWRLVKKLSN